MRLARAFTLHPSRSATSFSDSHISSSRRTVVLRPQITRLRMTRDVPVRERDPLFALPCLTTFFPVAGVPCCFCRKFTSHADQQLRAKRHSHCHHPEYGDWICSGDP